MKKIKFSLSLYSLLTVSFVIIQNGYSQFLSNAQFENFVPSGTNSLNGSTGTLLPNWFKITSPFGYLQIGPGASSWCQFNTDRPRFYLNKDLFVQTGNFVSYGGTNLTLATSGPGSLPPQNVRLTILASNGNVGIGLTNPAAPLQVKGDIILGTDNGTATPTSGLGGRWALQTQSNIKGDFLISPDDNWGILYPDQGIRLQKSTGNFFVGGDLNKVEKTVLGRLPYTPDLFYGVGYLSFNSYRDANGSWQNKTDGIANGSATMWSNSDGRLFFSSLPINGTTDVAYTDAEISSHRTMNLYWNEPINQPQITIGKGLSGGPHINDYMLAVPGKVVAKEIYVTMSNWADYVFENDYPLLSIDSLETYISNNKHLPNVPSTEEILETGVNAGETDRILLEKIEELTLYIIDQNKRIEALENQLNSK